MGPLRILILAVLTYIGYRLIMANFRKTGSDDKTDDTSGSQGGAITDVLVEDPVCGKLVPKQQAYSQEIENEQHYFCSKECCDKFIADKEQSE